MYDIEVEAMPIAHIHNKSAAPGRVWVGGCRKAELIKAGIPKNDIISEHDWGNWIFNIPRDKAELVAWNPDKPYEEVA